MPTGGFARQRTRCRKSAALLALGIAWTGAAFGWNPEAHVSIIRGALRLSPAAASRIPLQYRDALFKAAEYGNDADVDCMQHRGPHARREASIEAEKIFGEITASGLAQSGYDRATAIGRYLHFVADSAEPNPLARGQANEVRDYFANKDFIVFRDRVSLTGRLAEALRREGGAAQWADDAESGQASTFRLAVNLTIDALMLLPPAPGAAVAAADAKAPVVFVVNRIDNGFGATKSQFYSSTSYTYSGPTVYKSYDFGEQRVGGEGTAKPDLMQRQGVQVVEWQRENVRGSQNVRALLFNNLSTCAGSIVIKGAGWAIALPATEIPPRGVRKVTLLAPADLPGDAVSTSWKPGSCTWPADNSGSIPTDYRLVLDMNGKPPRFEGEPDRFVETPAQARPRAIVR